MTTELINTLETPGEFDALSNLRPGEPYFLLVGRDRLAPKLVQKWADENRERALAERDSMDAETFDRELRKSTQAEAIGWAMQAYKAGHEAAKLAEPPKESRPTYSGHELPEETKRRDAIQSARARAASALNNAVAEVAALRDLLDGVEPLSHCSDYVIADMQAASETITPRRPLGHEA